MILNNRNNTKGFASNTKLRKDVNYDKEHVKSAIQKDYVRTIQARSTTSQNKNRTHGTYIVKDALTRPYSNFAPSSGATRSNIAIDRSGSVGYDQVKSQLHNPSTILYLNGRKSNSKKIIANEYEDDRVLTTNLNGYDKHTKLNTIVGVQNYDNTLSNIYIAKQDINDLMQNPKYSKLAKKDSIRAKSNKRTNKVNFEKVYMHSPLKLPNRRPTNQPRLKYNNLNTCESGNIGANSVSPHMPKVKETIAREAGHHAAMKKRSEQNLVAFNPKQELQFASNKDKSSAFTGIKNLKDSDIDTRKDKANLSVNQSGIAEN